MTQRNAGGQAATTRTAGKCASGPAVGENGLANFFKIYKMCEMSSMTCKFKFWGRTNRPMLRYHPDPETKCSRDYFLPKTT